MHVETSVSKGLKVHHALDKDFCSEEGRARCKEEYNVGLFI